MSVQMNVMSIPFSYRVNNNGYKQQSGNDDVVPNYFYLYIGIKQVKSMQQSESPHDNKNDLCSFMN